MISDVFPTTTENRYIFSESDPGYLQTGIGSNRLDSHSLNVIRLFFFSVLNGNAFLSFIVF